MYKPTICLNMIVKNESGVILRCLASVRALIDAWVIVDTGSTDGTQKMIQECLSGIPGELYERPWIDFATNRNAALSLARNRGDYLLFIDADEELIGSILPEPLVLDRYAVRGLGETDEIEFQRELLINSRLDWFWRGKVHEELECPDAKSEGILENITLRCKQDGHRSKDPDKYLKDAALIEAVLLENPEDQRARFYLAQSYLSAGKYIKALSEYEKRSRCGCSDQEIYFSLYMIGRLQESFGVSPDLYLQSYWKAYHFRPSREEPLYRLIQYYNGLGRDPSLAYQIAKKAQLIPYPFDAVYIEPSVYRNGLLLQLADSCFHTGRFDEASCVCSQLLSQSDLPSKERAIVERNIACLKQTQI
jgi:glycosyltransferase involved in cell wall biosynthesis